MRRMTINKKNAPVNPDEEPDFYKMPTLPSSTQETSRPSEQIVDVPSAGSVPRPHFSAVSMEDAPNHYPQLSASLGVGAEGLASLLQGRNGLINLSAERVSYPLGLRSSLRISSLSPTRLLEAAMIDRQQAILASQRAGRESSGFGMPWHSASSGAYHAVEGDPSLLLAEAAGTSVLTETFVSQQSSHLSFSFYMLLRNGGIRKLIFRIRGHRQLLFAATGIFSIAAEVGDASRTHKGTRTTTGHGDLGTSCTRAYISAGNIRSSTAEKCRKASL